MPIITLLPSRVRITALPGETVYHAIRRHGHPIASSCDGDGVCDKCRLHIVDGLGYLSPPGEVELRFMRERRFEKNERMACQVSALGDISVRASYW